MNKTKILVENTKFITYSKILTQIFGLVVQIFVIRKLSVDIFGEFNFLLNIFVIFQIFSISPITNVFYRYLSEFAENNDYKKMNKLLIIGISISFFIFIILIVLVIVFKSKLINIFSIKHFNENKFCLLLFLMYFSNILTIIASSLLLHKYLGIYRILCSFTKSVIYISILNNLTLNKLLTTEIVYNSLLAILLLITLIIYLIKNRKRELKNKSQKNYKKRIFRFGIYTSLNQLGAGIIGKSSDYLIISAIGNPVSVGLYAFAHKIYGIFYKVLPMRDVLSIIRPLFFQKYAKNKSKKSINQFCNILVKIMLPLHILPFLIFFVYGKPIIKYIFDVKYLQAYIPTCIVLLSLSITAIYYPIGLVVQLFEKPEYAFYAKIVVVFSIFAGIFSMKFWGINGVVTATLIGNLLKNLIMFRLIKRHILLKYDIKNIFNYFWISIFTIIIFYIFNHFVNNLFSLLSFIVLYTIIYIFLIVIYHPYKKSEIEILIKISDSSKLTNTLKKYIIKIHKIKSLLSI